MSHIDDLALSLAAARHGLVTRRELRAAGVAASSISRRLTHGHWDRVGPGVYRLPGFRQSWEQEVAARVLAQPNRAASHDTAAHLLGLYRSDRPTDIEISHLRCAPTLPDADGAVAHETLWLPEAETVTVEGIVTTNAARTIVDLVTRSSDRRIRDLIHDALRRSLCGREELVAVAHARPRLNGVRRFRRIYDSLHPQAELLESPLEVAGLSLLRLAGLPDPVLQMELRDPTGTFLGRVDAAYPDARLAIEFDGAAWHSAPSDRSRDERRQSAIERAGWTVLRLGWQDLRVATRAATLARIRAALGDFVRR